MSSTTRPDICYAAGYLSRFMHVPNTAIWNAPEHVLWYLKGTKIYGLSYRRSKVNETAEIVEYSDVHWGQERPTRKSNSGYVFMCAGGAVCWRSKQQSIVAQSTVEAEFVSLSFAIREALWFRNFHNSIP